MYIFPRLLQDLSIFSIWFSGKIKLKIDVYKKYVLRCSKAHTTPRVRHSPYVKNHPSFVWFPTNFTRVPPWHVICLLINKNVSSTLPRDVSRPADLSAVFSFIKSPKVVQVHVCSRVVIVFLHNYQVLFSVLINSECSAGGMGNWFFRSRFHY